MSVQLTYEEITPQQATEMLGHNHDNVRPIRIHALAKYARDMANRRWVNTGESIKFDTNGRLVDGQHRLKAVVVADIPVWLWVARGVEPEAVVNVDTGMARGYADRLKFRNVPNRFAAGALLRRILMWEAGNPMGVVGRTMTVPTFAEMDALYDASPDRVDAAVRIAEVIRRAKVGRSVPAGLLHYFTNDKHPDEAALFFAGWTHGANLDRGDPILALRNRLMKAKEERMTVNEELILASRAWNLWLNGKSAAKLMIQGREPITNSNFPWPE